MQIQNSNINFQGTKLKYQKLEHIVRNTNNQFPRISPYRVNMRFGKKLVSQRFFEWIGRLGETVDLNRQKTSRKDYIRVIKNDIENVKDSKLGDCGESTALTLASLIANKIDNFKVGLLVFDIDIRKKDKKENCVTRSFNTTHEFVVLNADKKEITHKNGDKPNKNIVIMDAWMGYCGNVQKAFEKFIEVFMNGNKKLTDDNGYEYTYKPRIMLLDLGIKLTDKLSKEFAKNYPELVIDD